jgi:hypothetical protein
MSIKIVKGFDKNLYCRGFQYKVGRTYEIDKKPVRCTENGFHSCENPVDILSYYNPSESKYHEVEIDGDIDRSDEDTKVASSKITIGAELSMKSMVDMAIKFVFSKCDWSKENKTGDGGAASQTGYRGAASQTGCRGAASQTGNRGAVSQTGYGGAASQTGYRGAASQTGCRGAASQTGNRGAVSQTGYGGAASQTGDGGAASQTGCGGAASQTGDRGAASQTGYGGAASQTGYRGAASQTGYGGAALTTGYEGAAQIINCKEIQSKNGTAIALGLSSKVRASLGCWIVISEWNKENTEILRIKSSKVDGRKIKADTWYKLSKGRFIKA